MFHSGRFGEGETIGFSRAREGSEGCGRIYIGFAFAGAVVKVPGGARRSVWIMVKWIMLS